MIKNTHAYQIWHFTKCATKKWRWELIMKTWSREEAYRKYNALERAGERAELRIEKEAI